MMEDSGRYRKIVGGSKKIEEEVGRYYI